MCVYYNYWVICHSLVFESAIWWQFEHDFNVGTKEQNAWKKRIFSEN